MAQHTRRIPAWLMGLLVAAVVFVVVVIVINALGFGDDPVIDGLGLVGS